jgi:hypothetical protein
VLDEQIDYVPSEESRQQKGKFRVRQVRKDEGVFETGVDVLEYDIDIETNEKEKAIMHLMQ